MGRAIKTAISRRRGVLLLVVLSMLTLFMMLGVTYLVISTRARKTARAFADNVVSITASGINSQRLLDEAMMAVARGTTGTSAIPALQAGNDLLGDKYGGNPPETGTISGNATGSGIIAIPAAAIPTPHLLAGRVVTFTMPTLNDVSTRILRADSSSNVTTLYVAGGQTVSGAAITAAGINAARLASTSTPHFIVNGREFAGGPGDTNEAYDAFPVASGTSDPHLARITTAAGTVNVSPSFAANISGTTIDNDADGTPDSGWIDVGFPTITDLAGIQVKPKAAILVIDLDGRLNLNSHGSRTDLENTAAVNDSTVYTAGYSKESQLQRDIHYPKVSVPTTSGTVVFDMQSLPRGTGLGPAEISLFGPVVGSAKSTGLGEMLSGCPPDSSEVPVNDSVTGRPRPIVGGPDGRYGSDKVAWCPRYNPDTVGTAKPGLANIDDNNDVDRWVSSSGTANPKSYFQDSSTRYGTPSDLKGRMRVWTDAFGQPVYYKPYWFSGTTTPGINGRGLFADDDVIDDPYEIDLGRSGPRTSAIHASTSSIPSDSLFTPSDLEGVLRYFDPDSMRLPRRLLAICRDWASATRPLITTESWDTPAVTGKDWENVIASQFSALLQSPNAADFFSPETIMGHKMDLNRPFHGTDVTEKNDAIGLARRQQFAKHLYCLLVATFQKNSGAAPTPMQAEQLAQWAVNIIDFRDSDSIMTPFDYDETFAAGSTSWKASKRVWGAERPEILITETLAWHDRKTEDTDVAKTVTENDQTQADNDFDQVYRPRGAFFVELYSPWGSQAMQYTSTGPAAVTGTTAGNPPLRGEPLPAEFASTSTALARFNQNQTIDLSRTHSGTVNSSGSGTASPVWRLVTARGNVTSGTAFGTDAIASGSATSGTSSWIRDPSKQSPTQSSYGSIVDRIFYFTTPPTTQRQEKEGAVFWHSGTTAVNPSQNRYVVVGTDRLGLSFSGAIQASGSNADVDITFDQPKGKPATISEPIVLDDTVADGYDALLPSGKFTPDVNAAPHVYDRQLNAANAVDAPLDGKTTSTPGLSAPFLDSNGQPILMQNGTHENFAVVHLQRLADPTKPWDSTTNPYLTVDSMPVDLTVVNSPPPIGTTTNYDEPKYPSKDYRYGSEYGSTERGGKKSDNPASESDIWNRRVTANITSLTDPEAFRSGTVPANAQGTQLLPPLTPSGPYRLAPRLIATGTNRHSFATGANVVSGTNYNVAKPDRFPNSRFPWLVWANRPFNSSAELAVVPTPNAFRLPSQHTTGTSSGWNARSFSHLCGLFESGTTPSEPWKSVIGSGSVGAAGILDFVHVPSRFTGSYITISASAANASTIGLDNFPINQISQFREPGRVNVNTMVSSTAGAWMSPGFSWNPLFGKVVVAAGSGTAAPPPLIGTTTTGSNSISGTFTLKPPFTPPQWNEDSPRNPFSITTGTAASNLLSILTAINNDSQDNTGSWPQEVQAVRDHQKDAYFRYDLPMRMANMVTTRSNVYAIWVTIGYFDSSGNEIQPVRRNRAFYIFDRSIPVGYERGKDHNVRDAILLRRIIQ